MDRKRKPNSKTKIVMLRGLCRYSSRLVEVTPEQLKALKRKNTKAKKEREIL